MPDIQKITTEYIDTEDRLRIMGEIAPSQTIVLWLTQRLLHGLMGHLCRCLDEQSSRQSHSRAMQADVMHSFAQELARAQLPAQAPVRAGSTSRQWLVTSIDVTQLAQTVILTFKGNEPDAQASLTLHEQALRQWLSITFAQCQKAGWPAEVWPDWLQADSQPSATAQRMIH